MFLCLKWLAVKFPNWEICQYHLSRFHIYVLISDICFSEHLLNYIPWKGVLWALIREALFASGPWVQESCRYRAGMLRLLGGMNKEGRKAGKRDYFKHFNLGEGSEEGIQWCNGRRCCLSEVKEMRPWEKRIPWSWPTVPGRVRLDPAFKEGQ